MTHVSSLPILTSVEYATKLHNHERWQPIAKPNNMGWWPFSRKSSDSGDNLHIKGTRVWLDELREICERHHDSPEAGRMRIREMQVEWKDAHGREELDSTLFEGLERRSFQLLRATDEEWLGWLDDDEFWKPGWRAMKVDDDEP